jgi:uncharacterized damage-inducible protein DinB
MKPVLWSRAGHMLLPRGILMSILEGMKQLLSLMTEYNRTANEQLYAILGGGDSDLVAKPTGSYFETVAGLLNHVLVSDLTWLAGFRDSNLELPVLHSPVLEFQHPGWGKKLYDRFEDLENHRRLADSLFVEFVTATPEALFKGPIEITRPGRSQAVTFPFGMIVLHVLNHQTHHRGAVSQILDQNGIENDFSNIMQLLL